MYDLTDDREIRQLTLEGSNCRPIWTPDSKRITFSSDHEGAMSIYWMPADGSSGVERLTTAEDGTSHLPDSWSHDGEILAYTVERTLNTDYDICFVSPGGEPECLYDRQNTVYIGAQFSPDGRWIAYFSGPEAGEADVYVERFPPTGLPNQITYGGGRGVWPMWSTDGEQLFYRPSTSSGQPNALKTVDITTDPEFSFRNERTLPIEGFSTAGYYRDYDITPDGTEFLMTFPAGSAESPRSEKIKIVVNWTEELKQRVPVD
jgi:Tol biopolymer transport system component